MDMPRPGPAHARLEALAGVWVGEEQMSPSPWDPAGGVAQARLENRMALGGFSLIQDYRQSRDGKTSFEGHGVFSHDAAQDCYTLHWWDSMGMAPHVFEGELHGEQLTFRTKTPMGYNRTRFELGEIDQGRYTFVFEVSPDAQNWTTFMTGRYQRQDGAGPA